jgi:hypothetical protein
MHPEENCALIEALIVVVSNISLFLRNGRGEEKENVLSWWWIHKVGDWCHSQPHETRWLIKKAGNFGCNSMS